MDLSSYDAARIRDLKVLVASQVSGGEYVETSYPLAAEAVIYKGIYQRQLWTQCRSWTNACGMTH